MGGAVRWGLAALGTGCLLAAAGVAPLLRTATVAAPTVGPGAARLAAAVEGARAALGAGDAPAATRRLETAPGGSSRLLAPIEGAIGAGRTAAAAAALAALGAELRGGHRALPDSAAVRRAVARAYADPALHVPGPGAPSAAPNGLAAAAARWIRSALGALFHLLPRTGWIVLGVAVGLAGAWLAWWRLRAAGGGGPASEAAREGGPAAPDPEAAWRRAHAAAAAGRHGEAVRLAFQALLLTAARRHALFVDPAWTNAELLAAALATGAVGPRLVPLVATFDRVVYGGEDPGAEGWTAFARGCRAAEGAVP